MKIIIAGAGEVGTYLAKMLNQSNHDIIVIDTDKEKLYNISSHFDVLTVNGSATSISVLKDANIKGADLYIAVTETEESNITSSILAKKLGARKTIARIDNKEYLQEENIGYITSLGIDSLVYPEILASNEVISLIKQSGINKMFEFGDGKLTLFAIKIEKSSGLVNKTLIQVAEEHPEIEYRTVAITRDSGTIIPHGKDKFLADDLVYIVADKNGTKKITEFSGIKHFDVKNVMIMGGSRIGMKTAKMLETESYVKLLEKDKNKSLYLADMFDNTLVINAEGRETEFLLEEGIQNVDAFIAVTGNSEINILTCMLAKKLGAKKTIAEVENIDYIELAKNMGIDSIINKKLIAASHIFGFTMEANVSSVQCLTVTDAEVLEFIAKKNSKITKRVLRDIKFPKEAIIGGVVRGDQTFIATGNTQIEDGDKVVVFALPWAIEQVASLFK